MAAKKNNPRHPVEGGAPPDPPRTGPQYAAIDRMAKAETWPVSPPPPPTPPNKPVKRGARE